jgi:ABC-type Fe3+-hydroxamate transport system substrate-binding protein
MQDKFSALKITFVTLHPEGLAGVLADLRMIGCVTGHDDEGEATAKNIEAIRTLVMARWQDVPLDKRPRVLIRMGGVSPAPGSYVDDLLAAAGGRNVLPQGSKAWVSVSPESVLQLNPDLMVDIPLPDPSDTSGEPAAKLPGTIPVKTLANGKAFYRQGPDLGPALWQLARALYPGRFPESAPPAAFSPSAK